MARRKRLKWTSYIPVTIAIIAGGAIYELYMHKIAYDWKLMVSWAAVVLFFCLWRFDRRPIKTTESGSKGKIKRYK